MKSIFRKLSTLSGPLLLTRRDIFLTLLPALLWALATYSRPTTLMPYCHTQPELCSPVQVNPIDRISLGVQNLTADAYSFTTQNTSGYIALAAPALWSLSQTLLGKLSPATLVATVFTDLILLIETTVWNGLTTEASHSLTHRPRPFVYEDPIGLGANPAHYVSFYSGHTSFSSAILTAAFLILFFRKAPLPLLLLFGSLSQILIFSTGYFRVMAARHFLSDVVCGALFGAITALIVITLHRKKTPEPTKTPKS